MAIAAMMAMMAMTASSSIRVKAGRLRVRLRELTTSSSLGAAAELQLVEVAEVVEVGLAVARVGVGRRGQARGRRLGAGAVVGVHAPAGRGLVRDPALLLERRGKHTVLAGADDLE